MRLYTKTGDKGETGLIGGARVPKDDRRVCTIGEVDELNAMMGWAAVACEDATWRGWIRTIQDRLFVLGAELAHPGPGTDTPALSAADATTLERWIDEATGAVEPLSQFILPGGCELAARFQVARAVCRRAERSVVTLGRDGDLSKDVVPFLNRLADLLFAWSRWANRRAGVADVVWTAPDRT